MLQKEFFQVEPFNPNPYWDPVIVNLSGAQKFEENTIFKRGRYKIELAPGRDIVDGIPSDSLKSLALGKIVNMVYTEDITQDFIVRAYCGSDATDINIPGINFYSGDFKVNAVNGSDSAGSSTPILPIDVNHIFGAGGGNAKVVGSFPTSNIYAGGGANCLGDGNLVINGNIRHHTSGAGSCLHLLPVGGTFGTDYIRAYHASPTAGAGSAYGGAGMVFLNPGQGWVGRGGNSPYGLGATGEPGVGTGAGKGGIRNSASGGVYGTDICGAGAYFNGTSWIDAPGQITMYSTSGVYAPSSYIKITYLGPLY